MSSRAIASAKRRAGIETPAVNTPPPAQPRQQTNQPQGVPGGLTLPQVISLVDTRLIRLEQFMKETQENNSRTPPPVKDANIISGDESPDSLTDLNQILEEYNNRFIMLAEEMGQLKDTLMKLQTYTMDVNKMLLEERVNVLSDLGTDKSVFVMNPTSLQNDDVQSVEG